MILTRALSSNISIGSLFLFPSRSGDASCRAKSGPVRRGTIIAAAILVVTALLAPAIHAASINYGNFNIAPAGIMFLDVTESSGTDAVPLYGPPNPYVVGLDFNPQSFVATASGGASDITDGQLNYTVMGLVNQFGGIGIDTIALFESGDYTLFGAGTSATQAVAGAIISATIREIDGVAVAPISLSSANASVAFNLASNPGVVQPWSLGATLNIKAQVPTPYTIGATKVDIVINNQLLVSSQPSTLAFIAKKDFRVTIGNTPVGNPFIPEPTTLALTAIALCGVVLRARQPRS